MEVIGTNFKLKQKVKPGTRIILKYVTAEVVEASRKLFEESEKLKAEKEQEKAEKNKKKIKSIQNKLPIKKKAKE